MSHYNLNGTCSCISVLSCSTNLYIRKTETLELHWSRFLAPFRRRLWFAVTAAVFLLTTLLVVSHKLRSCYGKADSDGERFWESFYSICGAFCGQGKSKNYQRHQNRLITYLSYFKTYLCKYIHSKKYIISRLKLYLYLILRTAASPPDCFRFQFLYYNSN